MMIPVFGSESEKKRFFGKMNAEEKMEALSEIVNTSHKVAFFGGAGVSTESGIPDFRSKDGLYNQHDVRFDQYTPEYLLSDDCLYSHPRVFFEFYRQKLNGKRLQEEKTVLNILGAMSLTVLMSIHLKQTQTLFHLLTVLKA